MPKATCAELIALSVLCCLLVVSASDGQKHGCNVRTTKCEENRHGEKNERRKQKDEYRHVLLVPGTTPNTSWHCVVKKKSQDSRPPAPDATRYARERKNATETYVKGAGKRGPRFFGANIELMKSRGACAELIALRCAVRLFMSRSEGQYVMLFAGEGRGGGGGMGTESGKSTEENTETSTQRVDKPGTCIIPGTTPTAICQKKRTASHRAAPQNEGQGTAPHCAALCCWAIYSRADLSWGCIVHDPTTWYVQTNVVYVPVRGVILRTLLACMYELKKNSKARSMAKDGKARQSTRRCVLLR